MFSYFAKRIAYALATIWIIITVTFFLMNLVPGGPFLSEKAPSPEILKAMEAKYGLDKPLAVQYKNYLANIAKGDLGYAIKAKGQRITDIIADKFPVSAKLGGLAILTAVVIGIPLGSLAALKRGRLLDKTIMVLTTAGVSIPAFVIATALMIYLGVYVKIFPTYGLKTPLHYVLPVFSLAIYPMAYIARLMRSSLLDVLGQDYIRTARAKGVSGIFVLFKHALRNALVPVITYLGPLTAGILTGSFVIEKVFTIPGLGGEFISSITSRDYPMIMGLTVFYASLLVIMNLVVDILYCIVDPRIKLK
ncbi:MAG TPA: ABC transporter permease [Candidatus Atribacteria bacterium]|nr:ABC transporter permease [Candidatus Atribacteria bacterium]